MNGADYIALGELVDRTKGMAVVAAPGETCERVNPVSLPWLLAQGYIALAPPAPIQEALPADDAAAQDDVDVQEQE